MDRALVEVETPDLRDFPLGIGKLLVVLTFVEILQDRIEISDCMIVVLLLVEDAADVVDGQSTLLQILIAGHVVPS